MARPPAPQQDAGQSAAARTEATARPPPAPGAATLLAAPQPVAAGAAAQQAAQAFGSFLDDHNFSFVISSARSPDCPIVYASQSFFSTTGYPPAEVLGRNCRFLQGPGTSHQSVMQIRDALREERPTSVCLLNYRKDKTPFWNYFRLEPIRAPCGMVEWYIGVQADVTRLVEAGGGAPLEALAQQGEQQAASVAARLAAHEADVRAADQTTKCAVLECVPSSLLTQLSRIQDCFVLSDPNQPDCPIQYASQTFLKMCGYSCSEVVGRNCRFLQGPGTCPAAVQQIRDALAAEPPRPVTVTLLNYRKADASGHQQPFWNSLHISPLRDADGKVQFYVGVQMALTDEEASAEAAAAGGTAAAASAVPPQADPLVLLRQKGVVGSLRVATRALAQHGLRRAAEYQHAPSKAD